MWDLEEVVQQESRLAELRSLPTNSYFYSKPDKVASFLVL
jgi:hypothetical protein